MGDLSTVAARFDHDGYCVLRGEFPQHLLQALRDDAVRYSFTPPDPRGGGAFAMASLANPHGAPRLAANWLSGMLGRRSPQLADFVPNEASYQRYAAGGQGLRPHRDQRYYAFCVAVVTLEGEATFGIHSTRGRCDVVDEWVTRPGEVVLLRGWRPTKRFDGRRYHRVDAPRSGHRLMFQLRQNVAASATTFPFLDELTPTELRQATRLAAVSEALRR